jgi:hypothetical protein
MSKGYYIKKDNKDGLTLNIKKDQFIQYLQGLQDEWIRFKIYERDSVASNGLTYNMELIERKNAGNNEQGSSKTNANDYHVHPTKKVDY